MELAGLDPARVEALLLRYGGAGPRYTSYPTAPVWSERYDAESYACDLGRLEPGGALSVYVHVPFCRSLCHFCACYRMITRDAALPERYLDTLAREAAAVRAALPAAPAVEQLHWGGGTPTHLDAAQLRRLYVGTVKWLNAAKGYGFIGQENGEDVFVHFSSIQASGYRRLEKDQQVEFSIEDGPKGLQATDVVPI